MISEKHSNSTNVTERELQRQTAMQFTGTMLAFRDYLQGQRLYLHCRPVETCETADQRRGWNDAAHYEAERDLDCESGTDWQG